MILFSILLYYNFFDTYTAFVMQFFSRSIVKIACFCIPTPINHVINGLDACFLFLFLRSSRFSPFSRRTKRRGTLYLLVARDILYVSSPYGGGTRGSSSLRSVPILFGCEPFQTLFVRFYRAAPLFFGCCVLPAAPFDDAQCIGLLLTRFLQISLFVLPRTGYDALPSALRNSHHLTGRISSKCPFDCLKCFFCGFSVFSSFPASGKPCPNSQCSSSVSCVYNS